LKIRSRETYHQLPTLRDFEPTNDSRSVCEAQHTFFSLLFRSNQTLNVRV